jgi:hypothetical protein
MSPDSLNLFIVVSFGLLIVCLLLKSIDPNGHRDRYTTWPEVTGILDQTAPLSGYPIGSFGPLYVKDNTSYPSGTHPKRWDNENPRISYMQMSRTPWCNPPLSQLPQCCEMIHQYPNRTDFPGVPYEFNKL